MSTIVWGIIVFLAVVMAVSFYLIKTGRMPATDPRDPRSGRF